MSAIDKKTVERVARLSRLHLGEEELPVYASQLSSILSYIGKLEEIDTLKTPPTSHPQDSVTNVFRKDVKRPSLPSDDALSNAPDSEPPFFRVPQIIEGR